MKSHALWAGALLLAATIVDAKPGDINRCMDTAGQWVFTDQPCEFAVPDSQPIDEVISSTPPGSCPAPTLDALLLRVRGAFGSRDFNALSELYIWDELGGGGISGRISRLQNMVKDTLVRAHFKREEVPVDPQAAELAVMPKLPAAIAITVFQTRGKKKDAGELIERQFGFYRKAGCYWLS